MDCVKRICSSSASASSSSSSYRCLAFQQQWNSIKQMPSTVHSASEIVALLSLLLLHFFSQTVLLIFFLFFLSFFPSSVPLNLGKSIFSSAPKSPIGFVPFVQAVQCLSLSLSLSVAFAPTHTTPKRLSVCVRLKIHPSILFSSLLFGRSLILMVLWAC